MVKERSKYIIDFLERIGFLSILFSCKSPKTTTIILLFSPYSIFFFYAIMNIYALEDTILGFKLAEIEEGARITLSISNKENTLELGASIKKQLKDNIALITLEYDGEKRLNFDNVQVDLEHCDENGIPYIWHNVKLVSYKTDYVMQVSSDGVKHNRRGCFRVAVATTALLVRGGRGAGRIMIRDISLSGFSIADRKLELGLAVGDQLSVSFEDLGHHLDLTGRVVRIEEREDMIIYGLTILNMCKDLSSYVNVKQRYNKRQGL